MIILYSKYNCPACDKLKAEYKQKGIVYKEIRIGVDILVEEFIKEFPTVRTVPHVVEKQ